MLSNDHHVWATFLPKRRSTVRARYEDVVQHASREDAIHHARCFQRHYGTIRRSRAVDVVNFSPP